MTGTPTLAAAKDVVSSGTLLFAALSAEAVNANIVLTIVGQLIVRMTSLLAAVSRTATP